MPDIERIKREFDSFCESLGGLKHSGIWERGLTGDCFVPDIPESKIAEFFSSIDNDETSVFPELPEGWAIWLNFYSLSRGKSMHYYLGKGTSLGDVKEIGISEKVPEEFWNAKDLFKGLPPNCMFTPPDWYSCRVSLKPSGSIREGIDELFKRWRNAKTEISRVASMRKVSERTFIEGI